MGTWTLIQIVFDIFMACGLFVVVMRMNRAPKDDPRLSRGLQLLQSKIAVLEDLSDRTEAQVNQLTAILESKAREVQAKVNLADQHVQEIRVSMDRSLEVAKIFQDKIPHKEIIERQNTIKYVQAARMAHSGSSVDEIAAAVDLPRGEVEFIASVNRDRLMFDESQLPEWVATDAGAVGAGTGAGSVRSVSPAVAVQVEMTENQRLVDSLSRLQNEMQSLDHQLNRENAGRDYSSAYDVPKVETESLKKLGEEFRKAVRDGEAADSKQPFPSLESLSSLIPGFIEEGEVPAAAGGPGARANPTFSAAPIATPIANPAMRTEQHSAHSYPHVAQPTPPNTLSNALKESVAKPARVADIAGEALASATQATSGATLSQAPQASASAATFGSPSVSGESKIQAALRSTARPAATAKTISAEVEAARAVAREVTPKASAKSEVRKVIFPRIDGSDV